MERILEMVPGFLSMICYDCHSAEPSQLLCHEAHFAKVLLAFVLVSFTSFHELTQSFSIELHGVYVLSRRFERTLSVLHLRQPCGRKVSFSDNCLLTIVVDIFAALHDASL